MLLKNGVNDRSPSVKQVVELKLIPAWVYNCDNDLTHFLRMLDIQSDPELIEKLLFRYFKLLLKDKLNDGESRFHLLVKSFEIQYLNESKVFKESTLTAENSFVWRSLSQFCKEYQLQTKDEASIESDDELMAAENLLCDGINNNPDDIVDLISFILPELPTYCSYLEG